MGRFFEARRLARGSGGRAALDADGRWGDHPSRTAVFDAERFVTERGERHVIGCPRCAQLEQVAAGRFGWIDATNAFRPVPISLRGTPTWCGSTLSDLDRDPHAELGEDLAHAASSNRTPTARAGRRRVGATITPRRRRAARRAR